MTENGKTPGVVHQTTSEIQTMAGAVVRSGLFPDINTEAKAMALMLICQSENLHPMQALKRYHIIQGRPAMKADAILSDFQKMGGKMSWTKYEDTVCEAEFSHPNGGKLIVSWDTARATAAGLVGRDTWKKYPRQMLKARVISEGVRAIFPEACQGMYTPEEVQDFDLPKIEAPKSETPKLSAPPAPTPVDTTSEAVSPPEAVEPPAQGGEARTGEAKKPDDSLPMLNGKIEEMSQKSGTSAKGPWTRHGIKIGGEWCNTFSATDAACAKQLKAEDVTACYQVRKNAKGFSDLVFISELPF